MRTEWRIRMSNTILRLVLPIVFIALLLGTACSQVETRVPANNTELPDDISGLIERLGDPTQGNQNAIIERLAAEGEDAIEPLIEALSVEGNKQVNAGYALARIGEPAIPALVNTLENSTDYIQREGVIMALSEMGPAAASATDALQDRFALTTKSEQSAIMFALAKINPTESVIGMISASARIEDLRHDALQVLGLIGPDAYITIPGIIGYVESDGTELTKNDVISTLKGIGLTEAHKDITLETLEGLLTDESAAVRENAAEALGSFGPDAAESSDALAAALSDVEKGVQRAAATAIGMMAPASSPVIPQMIDALQSEFPTARNSMIQALAEFGPDASDALPLLRDLAENDPFDYVRTSARNAVNAIEGS